MAIETLFIDGFDHYRGPFTISGNFMFFQKWTQEQGNPERVSPGRSGEGYYWRLSQNLSAGNHSQINRYFEIPQKTWVVGMALRLDGDPDDGSFDVNYQGFRLRRHRRTQVICRINASRQIELRSEGYAGPILGTSGTVLEIDTWYYVELRVVIGESNGEWELRINGATEFFGSGDTQGGGLDELADDLVIAAGANGASNAYLAFDDLYVRGDTVSTAGGFLGEIWITHELPVADGAVSEWSRSGGTTDVENINEDATDESTGEGFDATDYLYDTVNGDRFLVAMEHISTAHNIVAVAWNQSARPDHVSAMGAQRLKPVCKSGTTTDIGASVPIGEALMYRYVQGIWETNPDTGAAWTVAELNAAEFGADCDGAL